MKLNKIYALETKTRICIGTYIGRVFDDEEVYVLKDVIQKNKPKNANSTISYFMRKPRKIKPNVVFTSNDIVYDLEEIRERAKSETGNGTTISRYDFETTG